MKRSIYQTVLFLMLLSCGEQNTQELNQLQKENLIVQNPIELTLEQANNLAQLPLACLQTEYPNKLGQTIGSQKDIKEPKELHLAFYGRVGY